MATDTIIPFSFSYRDAKGFIGRVRGHVAGDSSVGTNLADMTSVLEGYQVAVAALSNAVFAGGSWPYTTPTLAYGGNSEYPAEWMKAVYLFTTDHGQQTRWKIPAPRLSQFDTDGVTVKNDGSVAIVVNFINAVKNPINSAFICTQVGAPYTHFVGGVLRLGKQPKRHNEFIKSSGLIAGEGE